MKTVLVPLFAVLSLAGCATRMPESDRLALYQAHAGAPVKQVRNYGAIGWDRIDASHVLLEMRPRESWLLKLSGPCLDWSSGPPVLAISSPTDWLVSRFDRVQVGGSGVSCRIDEIRPVDTRAVRDAQEQLRAKAQASGT